VQVKIRLQRFGSKKRPFYRIIAAANIKKRDGRFLDIVGLYHPISAEGKQVRLDNEKIKMWLERGAQPTDTVKEILTHEGIWKDLAIAKENRRVAKVKKGNQKSTAKKGTASAKPAPQPASEA